MKNIELTVPDIGTDGAVEVIELCVEAGASVSVDDPILVLESDKATMELPATESGVLKEFLVATGDQVKQGDPIAVLEPVSGASKEEEQDNTPHDQSKGPESSVVAENEDVSNSEDTDHDESSEEQLVVPDLGGAEQVELIEILVAEGDQLDADQAIVVLESDKATMEIPTPFAGELLELSCKVGDKVSEGDLLGKILAKTSKEKPSAASESVALKPIKAEEAQKGSEERITQQNIKAEKQKPVIDGTGKPAHAGPAARKLARELGVNLQQVGGSGPSGRILKDDIKSFVKQSMQESPKGSSLHAPVRELPDFSEFGKVETREMDKIQRLTAKNMQASWLSVPHVTQFDQADITELESFRKSKKGEAEGKGLKLTPLPFIVKACAYALRHLPQFNVSLDMANEQIVQKSYVHIGIAVDTPAGLVVPVLRDADKKSIWQIAEESMDLAEKARNKKLSPKEMQGGCFTISSLGGIGGTAFTPIVNTPEVAILGVSKASVQPQYLNGEFAPRLMLPLSLSYDHRAVNGADGAKFTALVARILADIRELVL